MTRSMTLLALLSTATLVGCEPMPPPVTRAQPLEGAIPEGAVLFGIDADGAPLYGAHSEDRRAAHLPTTYVLHLRHTALRLPPVTAAALDAARGRLAWVTADGELHVGTLDGTAVETLASNVQPGLAFAPSGEALVFASGVAPELDVFIAPRDQAPHAVIDDPGPQYLPAFDGDRLLFVASGADRPATWVADRDGGGRRLLIPDLDVPTPDGAVAPALGSGQVAWFDGRGVTVVDDAAATVAAILPDARGVVRRPDGRLVLLRATGQLELLEEDP